MHLPIRSFVSVFIFIALASLSIHVESAHAQISKDTSHWNDEDLYTGDQAPPAYFAIGVGALGGYFSPDLSSLNANVTRAFMRKDLGNAIYTFGGQVFIAVPWIKNLRVGGMLYSGRTSACCYDTTFGTADTAAHIAGNPVNRFMEYSMSYGALTIDYVLPLHIKHFNIVPGIAVGYGSLNVYMRQAANRLQFDPAEFDRENPYSTHTVSASLLTYMPQVQFEYNPTGWLMFRLAAGYQGSSVGTWVSDRDISLGDTKRLDGTNGSGIVANFGVFFGLFQ